MATGPQPSTLSKHQISSCRRWGRARDADRLWRHGTSLFLKVPWVFRPGEVPARSLGELLDVLAAHRVSQRHGTDGAAWRIIAELLTDPPRAPALHAAIYEGRGDARLLLAELAAPTWSTRAGDN